MAFDTSDADKGGWAFAYCAKLHLRQVEALLYLFFPVVVCVSLAWGGRYNGAMLFGGGGLLALHAILNGMLARSGYGEMVRALEQAVLAGILFWMGWSGRLLTPASVITVVSFFVFSSLVYFLYTRGPSRCSLIVKDRDPESLQRFEELVQTAGGTCTSPFMSGDLHVLKMRGKFWLATDSDEYTTYVIDGIGRTIPGELDHLFSQLRGVFSKRVGCSFVPSVLKEYLLYDRLIASADRVVDAFVYGNSFSVVVQDGDGAPQTFTFAFGPEASPEEPFLKVLLDQPFEELCFLEFIVGEDLARITHEEIVGGALAVSIVHGGPLNRFGQTLHLSVAENGGEKHFAVEFVKGRVVVAPLSRSHYETGYHIPLRSYLEFWSSYSPAYGHCGDEASRALYHTSNPAMAPRGRYDVVGYDPYDYSEFRVGSFATLYGAVRCALEKWQELAGTHDEDFVTAFRVFDHDGNMLFSSGPEEKVCSRPFFLTEMLRNSQPYWVSVRDRYLKPVVGLFLVLCLASVPLFLGTEGFRESWYFWGIYGAVLVLAIALIYTVKSVALEARTGGGKIASFIGTIAVLLVGVVMFAKGVMLVAGLFLP